MTRASDLNGKSKNPTMSWKDHRSSKDGIKPSGLAQKLDPAVPIPLYHQAYLAMRGWITAGVYLPDDQFPTEAVLCDLFGVSRITIKRALSELSVEGLIERQRGKGTTVKSVKSHGVIRAQFGEMMKSLLDVESTTKVDLIDQTLACPPPDISNDLELDEGVEAQKITRRRLLNDEPYVYSVSFVPCDIAVGFPPMGAAQTSMLRLLISAGHSPHEAYQRMTASVADAETAGHLDLDQGAPVLKVIRVFKTAAMRPVQHTTMFFRPDRYEYTLVLPASQVLD